MTPYPLSVYDWFAIRRMTNLMLGRAQAVAGYPLRPGVQRCALFDGRLYLNLSIMQWELHDAFGFPPKVINNLVGGHQPEITLPKSNPGERIVRLLRLIRIMVASKLILRKGERIVGSTHDLANALRNEPLPETAQALVTRLRELVHSMRSQKSLFFLQAASGGTLPLLVNLLESHLPGEGHALASALLAGGKPTITAKQAYDLADLAKMARQDPIVEKWLADPRRNNDWNDALPEDNAFRIAFSGFLDRYGHRGVYETYIRHPRWRETPDYLFDTLHGLMKLDLEALREQQRLAADEAVKRARRHLPFWLRPLLKGLIKTSVEETRHREAARSALISLIEPQRRILLRVGQLLQQRGIAHDPNAVFELSLPELQSYVDGWLPDEGLAARLSDRRKQLLELHARSVADVLLHHADDRRVIAGKKPVPITDDDAFQGMAVG